MKKKSLGARQCPHALKQTLRIMKLSLLFLIVTTLHLSASVYSQSEIMTLKMKDATVKQVLTEIEQQTELAFFYQDEQLASMPQVSIDETEKSVDFILAKVFVNSTLDFRIVDKHVVIFPAKKPETMAQQPGKTVSGTVLDAQGQSIPGASIVVKNTTIGTITDMDGNFSLSGVPDDAILEFSFVGMKSAEVIVGEQDTFNIVLQEESLGLDEVVVVGYGTQKKINLTGAVESIDGEKLTDRPSKSITDALQGSVAGLIVQSGSGEPGNFSSYKIRGNTSINSGGALVIIDGIPGDINSVASQDIESMSILKDAASAAIYGARAAEGVVLITTKSGSKEKLTISYNANFSYQKPTRIPESVDALTYTKLKNEAYANAGVNPEFSAAAIEAIKDPSVKAIPNGNNWLYTDNFDWIDYMFDNAFQQTHNLSVANSSEGMDYLFSMNYLDQNGYYADIGPNNYDQYSFRLNTRVDIIKDMLDFDARISYVASNDYYHAPFAGSGGPDELKQSAWDIPYITFIQSGPNMPIYDPNGNYARYRMQANPVQALKEGGFGEDDNQTLKGNFTLTLKPLKDLNIKAVGGMRQQNRTATEWRRAYGKYFVDGSSIEYAGQSGPNNLIEATSKTTYFTGQIFADYNITVKKHYFAALAGFSIEEESYEYLYAKRQNISGNELAAMNLGSSDGMTNNSDAYEWALLSGFMRINYAFADKYLLEANLRADGSSRFSSSNRWGYFPSVSAGWRITEENFMENLKALSNLKLRVSYGELGNQNGLGYYDHIAKYTMGGFYPFGYQDSQWATLSSLPSESRTWETVQMSNFAIDMGLFNNRLTMTAEIFKKVNKDMLVSIEFPEVIGITVPTGNYGELETKGWEVSLGWQDQKTDFKYSINLNLTDQKDELTNYGVDFTGFTQGVNVYTEGYPLGAIFGYKSKGLFQNQQDVESSALPSAFESITAPGDIKYDDIDNSGFIESPNDLQYLGTTTPRYTFGINFNAQWKNIDLSLLLQGVGKRNFYLGSQIMNNFRDSWSNFAYTLHEDYWTKDNPNASMPRLYMASQSSHNTQISDYWMQDASYCRLKNLQIGYTLDGAWTTRLGMEKLRLYFSGDNLLEYSNLNKYFDPELTNSGGFMYPIARSYSLGINLTF